MRAQGVRAALATLLFLAGINSESPKEPSGAESRVQRLVVQRTPLRVQPLSALAPAPFSPLSAAGAADAPRGQRSAANDRWARFFTEYARSGQRDGRSSQFPSWAKDAVMVDLPLGGGSDGRPSSVPVLVLPVPVPVKDSGRGECAVRYGEDKPERFEFSQEDYPPRGGDRRPRPPPKESSRPVEQYDDDDDYEEPAPTPRPRPRRPPATPQRDPPASSPRDRPRPFGVEQQTPAAVVPPTMGDSTVNSQVLVELFRSQKPSSPQMPPVLIRDRRYDADAEPPAPPAPPAPAHAHGHRPGPANAYLPATTHQSARDPPPPRFDRALMLRGELTVYRADYTEPYTAIWDPATGAARVELHGGTTVAYRSPAAGGHVQRVVMSVDRTNGDTESVRCAVLRQGTPAPFDKLPPVLPDVSKFSYDGQIQFGSVKAEKWRHTVTGRAGELGGARGEVLTFRHELLLMRGHNNFAIPLQYSVAVDSSVLGPDCDGYVHRYHEVREQKLDPALFQVNIDSSCQQVEETTDLARVEPLLEFTMLSRDPRYDEAFKGYTEQHGRKYADATEEAVRKNLVTQSMRFVASGNRIGATFSMGVNFLSDRLDSELSSLLGVVQDAEHFAAETFPHERQQLRELENKLPEEFDWRQKGGVSSVRYQGTCSSCWAFAVAGSVEGALFRVARKLVPLSEQCLVDCAHPYGGQGCGGTWPSHAYDYVQDRGLPALNEYPEYQAKVLQCQDKRVPPVTQISAHVNVTQFSVPALKVAIRKHAPTVVIIDAALKSFQTYKSGVFYDDRCSKQKGKLKHAVLAVGWGQRKGEPHFILKNSWSAGWGDGGYIHVHGPSNTCGVLTLPSYPRLERSDVLRVPDA